MKKSLSLIMIVLFAAIVQPANPASAKQVCTKKAQKVCTGYPHHRVCRVVYVRRCFDIPEPRRHNSTPAIRSHRS